MGISELYIVKRDGKRKAFSVEKIKRAVRKAFLSVGSYATDDDITSILSRVHVSDGMSVEEIQNQVEVALMAERYSRWPRATCSTARNTPKSAKTARNSNF